MKCFYYLTSTLDSTRHIIENLHKTGINDWFIHVLSRDMPGLKKEHIRASNYLEQLDLLRPGMIGAIIGFLAGLSVVMLMDSMKPFGPDVPAMVYYAITGALTLFGAWEGGLIGIANENKKIAIFHDEIEAGHYLILIYAQKNLEDKIKSVLGTQHPEAKFVAVDKNFYNPLTELQRI